MKYITLMPLTLAMLFIFGSGIANSTTNDQSTDQAVTANVDASANLNLEEGTSDSFLWGYYPYHRFGFGMYRPFYYGYYYPRYLGYYGLYYPSYWTVHEILKTMPK